jgi:hypothetical protein
LGCTYFYLKYQIIKINVNQKVRAAEGKATTKMREGGGKATMNGEYISNMKHEA